MTDLCLVLSTTPSAEEGRGIGRRLVEEHLHSYSVPEIIAFPIDSGASAHVEWVRGTAAPGGGEGSQ